MTEQLQVGDKVKFPKGRGVWEITQINVGSCDTVAIIHNGSKQRYHSLSSLVSA